MKNSYFLSIAISSLLIANPANAGDQYSDQVKAQLAVVKLAAMTDGWEETHNDKLDKLNDGEHDSFNLNLQEGKTYVVFSVCDEDCKDLDSKLYNEDGDVIGEDSAVDDFPAIKISPTSTGKYDLRVKMYDCKDNPCYYGIGVIGKNSDSI